MAKVRLVARLVPKQGKEEELAQVARPMLAPTHQESGCEFYELFVSHQSGRLLFNELWESQQAFDAHMKSSHFEKFAKAIEPLLKEPLELNFLTEIEE
jgi:quinol monooxygenase YgiN